MLLGWSWGVGTHGVQSINMEINFMHMCVYTHCDRIYTRMFNKHIRVDIPHSQESGLFGEMADSRTTAGKAQGRHESVLCQKASWHWVNDSPRHEDTGASLEGLPVAESGSI